MYIYPHDAIDSFGEESKIDKSMRSKIQLLTADIELLIWTHSETSGTKTFYWIKLAPGTRTLRLQSIVRSARTPTATIFRCLALLLNVFLGN